MENSEVILVNQDSLKINRLCRDVQVEMEAYERFMALHEPQWAPKFNVTDLFSPNENRLSSVLAALLDPHGEHGQGAVFLNLFLEAISQVTGPENHRTEGQLKRIEKLSSCNFNSIISRSLEVPTSLIENNRRRIDILLDLGGFSLAFENKPWTCDQPNQVKDYLAYLEKLHSRKKGRNDSYLLVYLSGKGQPPIEESIGRHEKEEAEQKGDLIIVSYSQMLIWLENCLSKCKADKVRFFLDDFKNYINVNFVEGNQMEEKKEVIKTSITKENVKAAVAIGFCWPQIARALIDELCKQLKNTVLNDPDWCEPEVTFDINSTNTGFYFKKHIWMKRKIGFVFDGTNAVNFCFGVCNNAEDRLSIDASDIMSALDDAEFGAIAGAGKGNEWWPWWQEFLPPYKDWSNNYLPWAGIPDNGATVEELAKILKSLIEKVEDKFM